MTETKVVVAAFDANGNGFSNCELVIRTVPGHISQQAADPAHLPAEVLEHLVDWALAGLEEQTPTTDMSATAAAAAYLSAIDLDEEVPADPGPTRIAGRALDLLVESQLLVVRTLLAVHLKGDGNRLAEIENDLASIRRRHLEPLAFGEQIDTTDELHDRRGDVVGDGVSDAPVDDCVDGLARISTHKASPSAGDAGAHSVEGDRSAPSDAAERTLDLAAEFGYPLAEVNDFLLEILHLREQKTDDKPEPLLDGQAFPPALLEARHRVPQLSGDPELGVEVTRTDLAERLGIGDLVEIFWLLVGHMSSPSAGDAGAHSVGAVMPAPLDGTESSDGHGVSA